VPGLHLMGAEDGVHPPGAVARKNIPGESYVEVGTMSDTAPTFDAIVVGAGFGGIRMLHELARDAFLRTNFNPSTSHGSSAEEGWAAAGADRSFAKVLQSCRAARLSDRTR
jgi:hypothetical protein